MMKTAKVLLIIIGMIFYQHSYSQNSQEELSKQAANPVAYLISFPFQNNLNINYGPYNRNMNILNIQPVIPFAGGRIITRTINPFISIPDFGPEWQWRAQIQILLPKSIFSGK
jgi:hypothetical protein